MGVDREMSGVRRLCIDCNSVFDPGRGGNSYRCLGCERKRSRQRSWYKTAEYRAAQREARYQRGKPCPLCGEPMRRPSVDHIQAIAAGGPQSGPFQVICLPCNVAKQHR
jgi:hypothetical protein